MEGLVGLLSGEIFFRPALRQYYSVLESKGEHALDWMEP
jgi:hypothetical protein